MPAGKIEAFRGVSGVVIARLTETVGEDGAVTATYDDPVKLAGAQQVSVSVSESAATHYFDNVGAIVISAEGECTVTLVVSRVDFETRALIEGRTYDTTKEALIGSPQDKPYFALGFKGKITDKTEEYWWLYKGQFTAGELTFNTEDDGTDISTMTYTYTAVYTSQEYTYNTNVTSPVKYAIILSTNEAAATFFDEVTTPDKIGVAA